jgi:hypothetical protein
MKGRVVAMQMLPCATFLTDPDGFAVWGWALVDDGVSQTVEPVVYDPAAQQMTVMPGARVNP